MYFKASFQYAKGSAGNLTLPMYLRMTNDGTNYVNRTSKLSIWMGVPVGTVGAGYPGFAWNPPTPPNCDNCGGNYNTGSQNPPN